MMSKIHHTRLKEWDNHSNNINNYRPTTTSTSGNIYVFAPPTRNNSQYSLNHILPSYMRT